MLYSGQRPLAGGRGGGFRKCCTTPSESPGPGLEAKVIPACHYFNFNKQTNTPYFGVCHFCSIKTVELYNFGFVNFVLSTIYVTISP